LSLTLKFLNPKNTVFITKKYIHHPIFSRYAIKYGYWTGEIWERWGALDTKNSPIFFPFE
ncbi:MAG: hypothetical protein JSW26_09400, partial [Desulfobacterales bacterium]